MKRSAIFYAMISGMLVLAAGCSPKLNSTGNPDLTVTSMSPVAPVFKGLPVNPMVRVRIHIPAGQPVMQLQSISGTMNTSAIRDLAKLEIYGGGSEPFFNEKTRVAELTSLRENFNMPVSVELKPGLNYLWISSTLRPGANIDNTVEVHVKTITDSKGNIHNVAEDLQTYEKHIGVAVRKAWEDSVHTYRIPGMATTDKGTLIAVYDIRYKHSGDLPANIDVGMSRSTDGGSTWEPMKIIMDMGEPNENNGVGDPSILYDPVTKKIWVSALWSKGNRSIAGSQPGLSPDETGQFVLVSSSDDGLTWTKPYTITPQVKNPAWKLFFPGPGSGIAMQNGTIVFPAQYWDANHMPHSTLVYSTDHGQNWKSGIGAKSNTTESQLVETLPGTLMLNMRDNRGNFRSVATTTDMGKTWTEHSTSYKALVDPVCMASIIKAGTSVQGEKKEVLFFSNVASQHARIDMTVKASLDLGETWLPQNSVLIDERKSFGYSSLTQVNETTLGLLYEGARDLYFVRIPIQAVIGGSATISKGR